jgi:hypothetical protein
MYLEHLFRLLSEAKPQAMSVEFYGVERYVTGGMHVLSVRPVLVRVDNAAVDVSERRNPEISSRIVILAQRVPRVVA